MGKKLKILATNQQQIIPKGLTLAGKVNAVDFYLSSFASESDEYQSDVPDKERVPLVTNTKVRHLKILKRNKDLHHWKKEIDDSELQQVKEWTDRVSNKLAEFDINPARNRKELGEGEGEGREVESFPFVETFYSEATETDCSSRWKEREKKKKKKKKKRISEVESTTDCESVSVSGENRKEKKKKKNKSKKRGELVDISDTDNLTESGCEVGIGGKREKEERRRERMKRQRESGSSSEDGGGRMTDKRGKRQRHDSETEGEASRKVASKKGGRENIVEVREKEKRKSFEQDVNANESLNSAAKSLGNRSVSTDYSENVDSDVSTNFDFRENVRKNRENFLKTVAANRGEKRHSMSDASDEDCGMEESTTKGKSETFESCLRKQRLSKSPTNTSGHNTQSNNDISESSNSDADRPNQGSSKSPIKKSPVKGMSDSDRPNQRSSKSPIKKVAINNDSSDSSDSGSEVDGPNKSLTSNFRENKQNDKNLKLNSSSLMKSTNNECMSQDIFEQDSDEINNVVQSNGDNRSNISDSRKMKKNGDKSRNSDSDSDSDDKNKNNLKSNSKSKNNSDKSMNRRSSTSESNSDSDSNSKKQKNSKKSPKATKSKQGDTTHKLTTKSSEIDGSKSKSKEKATNSLLNSSEILSNFDRGSQELFKTPTHKKKTATSTPFHSQMTQQDLEQIMDMSAISNRSSSKANNNSSKANSNSSRANNGDGETSSSSEEEGSTVRDSQKSYSETVIPKLWNRIEKKLSEGLKDEYFENDVFYVEDLSDNDEVWVAPCPKSVDISSLLGRKLNLTGRSELAALRSKDGEASVDCEAWATAISEGNNGPEDVVYCLQASRDRRKVMINSLKLAGRVTIEEKIRVPSPHEVELSTTMKLVMPESIRVRHPLLGAEFKNQPKTFNSVDSSSPRIKKKKKKSRNLESESEPTVTSVNVNNHTSIEETCDESMVGGKRRKKDKKKSRGNESVEGGEDLSSYSHKSENVSEDTSYVNEEGIMKKKKKKKDKKRHREEENEEVPSYQEDASRDESSDYSSKKKKKKKKIRLDE